MQVLGVKTNQESKKGDYIMQEKAGFISAGIFYIILIVISSIASVTVAQDNTTDEQNEFLYNFLQGSYDLIGKFPDSDKTYCGRVIMTKMKDRMLVVRKIAGRKIKGTGHIETATADNIKILRVRFKDGDKNYETTYLISSDLDNYARLSGHLYLKDGKSRHPGLEALFINRNKTNKAGHSRTEKKEIRTN